MEDLKGFKIPDGLETRPIEGFEHYRVSVDGRVFTRRRTGSSGGELVQMMNGTGGYPMVLLRRPGQKKVGFTVHRLVAIAFVDGYAEGLDVRHLDGTRTNNHADNLAWGTRADNMADAREHGTMIVGEASSSAKLTASDVREIRRRRRAGELCRDIAQDFPVSRRCISAVGLGKTWKHIPMEED